MTTAGTRIAKLLRMAGMTKGLLLVGTLGFVVASGCVSEDSDPIGPGAMGSGGQASGGSGGAGGVSNDSGGMGSDSGGMGNGGIGGFGGKGGTCFSPTQNLNTAYDSGSEGCPCSDQDHARCVDGVALICEEERWQAVEDGPCAPSECTQELDIDLTCDIASYVGFWHNSGTGQCEPFLGGCPRNDNGFFSFEECADACQDKITTAAVVPWPDCEGLGEQVSDEGDESTFTRRGNVIEKEFDWGCGCPTGPVFTMAYSPSSPLELHLCQNSGADTCEAFCSRSVSFDLSQALQEAQTTDFVFAAGD